MTDRQILQQRAAQFQGNPNLRDPRVKGWNDAFTVHFGVD